MATQRERPYNRFNFLVDLGDGNTEGPDAGFAEVSGLGMQLEVIEYRNGNAKENAPMLLPGLARTGRVTLRRGVIGSPSSQPPSSSPNTGVSSVKAASRVAG
mgnify:CR=1 FL=1